LSEDGSKPKAVLQHFFDGLGMLHKFRMKDGRVFYQSRHTAEGVVSKAKKQGFVSTVMFGVNGNTPLKMAQDPCSALLGAQVSFSFIIDKKDDLADTWNRWTGNADLHTH
jgi:torulene dioxygenase